MMQIAPAAWLIVDRLEAVSSHRYRLHWLFADRPFEWDAATMKVSLSYPEGDYVVQVVTPGVEGHADVQRGSSDGRGWRSPYYYSREPALSFAVTVDGSTQDFATLLAPMPATLGVRGRELEIVVGDATTHVAVSSSGTGPLVAIATPADVIASPEVHAWV